MSEADRKWHESFKPSFASDGRLVYRVSKLRGVEQWEEVPVVGDGRGVVVMGKEAGPMVSEVDCCGEL